MKHYEGTFQGFDGLDLFWQYWQPLKKAKGVLVFIHGIGDHSSRHASLVNHSVESGYAFYTFDLRGNGRSPGQRGHINSWRELSGDLGSFLQLVRQQKPSLTLFLMGFSMGSVITLEHTLHYPEGLAGVIIASAPLGRVGVSPFLMSLGKVTSLFWPRFSVDMRIDKKWISRDPEVVKAHREDLLGHGMASARMGSEFEAAVSWTQAHATDLQVPLLVLHGSANRIAEPEGSRRFFENVTFSDKQYNLYEGAYHELDDDFNKEQFLEDLTGWMDKHL